MKSYQIRSKVLTMANALVKKGWSFSSAQKHCWQIVRCIEEMKKSEVAICYTKNGEQNPEQRVATLAPVYLPVQVSTTTTKRKANPLQINYFDTNKNGWRSFMAPNFVGFVSQPLPF